MEKKKFNTLVFVMRGQPFHNGHKTVIDKALECAHEVVIVLGSADQPRSIKNPFTVDERKQMIRAAYPATKVNPDRIKIRSVMDYPYDDNAWVSAVQREVNGVKIVYDQNLGTGLIGHSKDHSSYYLRIFPDWRKHIEVDNVEGIDATAIRDHVLAGEWSRGFLQERMPLESIDAMNRILYQKPYREDENGNFSEIGEYLYNEYKGVSDYKKSWETAPYTPTFVTTDAVLTQSGYILLIQRGGFPYKDQWALPGGYLAPGHFVEDNMIKELREETCVKVPDKVLRGSIRDREIFDHPDRDPRGRTITHGFHIDLGFPNEKLPKVKGADDAKNAKWFPLSQVKPGMMAFDHYAIIKHFIPTYS